jgi:hypothetical protein
MALHFRHRQTVIDLRTTVCTSSDPHRTRLARLPGHDATTQQELRRTPSCLLAWRGGPSRCEELPDHVEGLIFDGEPPMLVALGAVVRAAGRCAPKPEHVRAGAMWAPEGRIVVHRRSSLRESKGALQLSVRLMRVGHGPGRTTGADYRTARRPPPGVGGRMRGTSTNTRC